MLIAIVLQLSPQTSNQLLACFWMRLRIPARLNKCVLACGVLRVDTY